MDIYQLSKFIVYPVLMSLEEFTPDALRLVVGTAGKESSGGNFIAQTTFNSSLNVASNCHTPVLPGGIGPFQNEAHTHDSLMENYIKYRPDLVEKMETFLGPQNTWFAMRCLYDWNYATAICRLRYEDAPGSIPSTIEDMAEYWKKYYNTKTQVNDQNSFVLAYNTLCEKDVERFLNEIKSGGG